MAAYPPLEHLQVYCKPCHAKVTRGKQSQLDTSDAEWASFIQTRGKEHASKSEIELEMSKSRERLAALSVKDDLTDAEAAEMKDLTDGYTGIEGTVSGRCCI